MGLLAATKQGGCSAQEKLQASVKRQDNGLNRPAATPYTAMLFFTDPLYCLLATRWSPLLVHGPLIWSDAEHLANKLALQLQSFTCKPSFLLISQKIPPAAHIAEKGLFQMLKLQANHKHMEKQQYLFFYPTPASQILPWAAGCISSLLW